MAELPGGFVDVPEAIAELQAGRMIVVVDDEDRENEGDLTLAAEFCTPEAINFMAKYGRGLICLTLTEERADALRLSPMTQDNTSRFGTAFTESIEAREGVTTGISAADRAHTIQVAIAPGTTPNDLARPGHVFPLRARKGGVLVRAGQTEASVDLARMAGLIPAGVICEIMNEDGTMARVPDLRRVLQSARPEDADRRRTDPLPAAERALCASRRRGAAADRARRVPDDRLRERGRASARRTGATGESHVALVYGDLERAQSAGEPVLVRVHTHCLAGNLFGSSLCNCQATLDGSMRAIAEAGAGAIVYLHHTQRGLGVDRTVQPPRLAFHRSDGRASGERSEDGHQRVLRQVGLGGQILSDLGIRRIMLLSNHPTHVPALQGFGIEIVGQTPIPGVTDQETSSR